MKGLGILLVILGHMEIPFWMRKLIFSFHMPLFFILAGYFFKPLKFTERLKKDFFRLLIPYLLTMFVLVLYSIIGHYLIKDDHENAFPTFWTVLFPSGHSNKDIANIVPIWFLCALFWCKNIFNLLFQTINKQSYLLLVVLTIGLLFTYLYQNKILELPFSFVQGFSAIIFFVIGYLANKHEQLIKNKFAILLSAIWFLGFYFSKTDMAICKYNPFILYDYIIAIGGVITLYIISKRIERCKFRYIPNLISWIGTNSLVILCAHTFEKYLSLFDGYLRIENFVILLICKIIFCILITWICYKYRLTRYVFGLKPQK